MTTGIDLKVERIRWSGGRRDCDHYATQPIDGTTVAHPEPRPGYVECLRCAATRKRT